MKKKRVLLGIAALLCVGMTGTALASEEAATELSTETADYPETIELQIEGQEPISVTNTAKLNIASVSTELQEDEEYVDITMVGQDGIRYEFDDVRYVEVVRPELVQEGAFAYLRYTSLVSGEERSKGQTGELTYSEAAKLFAVDDVYIRETADGDSEILGVINRGDEIEVLGETASFYKVKKDDVTGYTARSCVSEDEEDAIAAVRAEAAAREAIRAAQEAAAAAAARQAAAQASASSSVHETGRQRYDDCDGSGHGYYEITYSDGSTRIEEY